MTNVLLYRMAYASLARRWLLMQHTAGIGPVSVFLTAQARFRWAEYLARQGGYRTSSFK